MNEGHFETKPTEARVLRGSLTVTIGGLQDAGSGFKIDGETVEVTFFGGADPHDPSFWRKVYEIQSLYGPDSSTCYMLVKLVERIHRYGGVS